MCKVIFENLNVEIDTELILKNLKLNENDIVYISGSLAEKIGNKYSDLDVYVLCEDISKVVLSESDYENEKNKTQFFKVNSINCDVEYWQKSVIEDIFNQIKLIDMDNKEVRTLNQLNLKQYTMRDISSFIHRFVNGIPIYNENKFVEMYEDFEKNNFNRLMIRYYINISEGTYEDILGNIDSNQVETGYINSRKLLKEVLMAFLFLENKTIENEKWLFEKLKSLDLKNNKYYDDYLKLYFYYPINNRDDMETYIKRVLNYSNKLINFIMDKNGGI